MAWCLWRSLPQRKHAPNESMHGNDVISFALCFTFCCTLWHSVHDGTAAPQTGMGIVCHFSNGSLSPLKLDSANIRSSIMWPAMTCQRTSKFRATAPPTSCGSGRLRPAPPVYGHRPPSPEPQAPASTCPPRDHQQLVGVIDMRGKGSGYPRLLAAHHLGYGALHPD